MGTGQQSDKNSKQDRTKAEKLLSQYESCAALFNLITILLIVSLVGQWGTIDAISHIEFGIPHYVVTCLPLLNSEVLTGFLTSFPDAHTVVSISATGILTLVFILIGFLAYRRFIFAYKFGFLLYGLDAVLALSLGNFVSFGVHVWLLIIFYRGTRIYKALLNESALKQEAKQKQQKKIEKRKRVLESQKEELGVIGNKLTKHVSRSKDLSEESAAVDAERTMAGSEEGGGNSVDLTQINELLLLKRLLPEPYYRYKSQQKIARGGMGVVYSVKDNSLSRTVALKRISLPNGNTIADRLSFIKEARVNALLEHPNIIPVHDIGLDDQNEPFYTMKKVDGKPLSFIVQKLGEGDEEFTTQFNHIALLQIFIKVCHAISFAHSKGIIHLDIKPENILVGDYGETLVMDWGISQKKGQESQEGGIYLDIDDIGINSTIDIGGLLHHSGSSDTIMGTPMYMAPEQITGEVTRLDERADIYALGSMLYNLLTLQMPHKLESGDSGQKKSAVIELLKRKVSGEYIPPSKRCPGRHIPSELNAIVNKSMAISKKERYQTVDDMIKDIMNFLEDRSISAQRDSIIKRVKRFYRKKTALCSSVMLTVVFLTIFGFAISYHYSKISRASKQVYSHIFNQETIARSKLFARRELSIKHSEESLVTAEGSLVLPGKENLWFTQDVIGNLEVMIEFSWKDTLAPLYIAINCSDNVPGAQHYFASLGLLDGALCKLGKQSDAVIRSRGHELHGSENVVSRRFRMKPNTRYRALIRHEANITELYINGILIAEKHDPMYLTGKMNGKIMLKCDNDSMRVHSLQVTKLEDPTLVSPAKLGDILFARKKFENAAVVYLDVFETYHEEEIRQEALYMAALSHYSLKDYDRFDKLVSQFVERYDKTDMADSLHGLSAEISWMKGNYTIALASAGKIKDKDRKAACLNGLILLNKSNIPVAVTEQLIAQMNELPDMMTVHLKKVGLQSLNRMKQRKCLELFLDGNKIYSLEHLGRFTELKRLSLAHNPVSALKPLSALSLTDLNLAHTKAKDLSHLSKMDSLRVLDIRGVIPNTYSSLQPLRLEVLKITLKSSTSLLFLKDMDGLKSLVVNGKLYSGQKLDRLKKVISENAGKITWGAALNRTRVSD